MKTAGWTIDIATVFSMMRFILISIISIDLCHGSLDPIDTSLYGRSFLSVDLWSSMAVAEFPGIKSRITCGGMCMANADTRYLYWTEI